MFSKSCKYAVRAVLFLATRDKNEVMGVDELANHLDVPRHFLAKILQQLSRNQLISSSKGRKGGFFLSEENRNANLIAVIECIEGPGIFSQCVLGLSQCSAMHPCPYHHIMKGFHDEFYRLLKDETIDESAQRTNAENLILQNHL